MNESSSLKPLHAAILSEGACPKCAGKLDITWTCRDCDTFYDLTFTEGWMEHDPEKPRDG
jgi:hypothetical protein